MSKTRFIKFIPSDEAMFLLIHKPNAFRLLTIIADRARRENGLADGLNSGQCYLGDWEACGLTEKEYRTAKTILVNRGHIKIIETCRTRKKQSNSFNLEKSKKSATEQAIGRATVGTLIELISLTVYDINSNKEGDRMGDRMGDRGATEGRPRGDKQEGTRKNNKEEDNTTCEVVFYECLKNLDISDENRMTLMAYEEERVKQAVAFASHPDFVIKTSLMGSLVWHCKQSVIPTHPPKAEEKKQEPDEVDIIETRKFEAQQFSNLHWESIQVELRPFYSTDHVRFGNFKVFYKDKDFKKLFIKQLMLSKKKVINE